MIQSIVLDALLLLIILLLIPLGAYRGGIREGFTSTGLLLGVALAAEWAVVWGDWIADQSRLNEGSARFLIATGLLAVTTIGVGYASAAAFAYRPGPGGRLYGALLAGLNGIVFLGFIFDYVETFLFDGNQPTLVADAYVARALATGTGIILLVAVGIIMIATLFGSLVRERADDESMGVDVPEVVPSAGRIAGRTQTAMPAGADKFEPMTQLTTGSATEDALGTGGTMPVQVREIRHWERDASQMPPPEVPASGWSRTWPANSVGPVARPPWAESESAEHQTRPKRGVHQPPRAAPGSEVLRHWLRQDPQPGDPTDDVGDAAESRSRNHRRLRRN